jgi:hypothetical protein
MFYSISPLGRNRMKTILFYVNSISPFGRNEINIFKLNYLITLFKIKFFRWFEFNFEDHYHHCGGNMKIHYILLALEHLLSHIYSLKIGHFDAKFIRDLNFKHKTHRIIILLSSTLVIKYFL